MHISLDRYLLSFIHLHICAWCLILLCFHNSRRILVSADCGLINIAWLFLSDRLNFLSLILYMHCWSYFYPFDVKLSWTWRRTTYLDDYISVKSDHWVYRSAILSFDIMPWEYDIVKISKGLCATWSLLGPLHLSLDQD